LGKEIIQVFGGRVGKSGMSLFLSGLTYAMGAERFGIRQLSQLSTFVALSWLSATWSLSRLVLSKDQAEKIVAERQRRANLEKEQEIADSKKQS
jgi:ATP/ADP translocase